MHLQRNVPMLVAAFVAVVGTAVILFDDFRPDIASQGSGSARMNTAAAVSRVGAIEVPSAPRPGRSGCASDPVLPGDEWLPSGSMPNPCNPPLRS